MTKTEKVTRRSVLASFLALAVCVSMLVGTSYAWFTDSVTSSGNIIKSGKLDVEMYWADGKGTTDTNAGWKDASAGAIFKYELWEPGYVAARHINIKNVGSLAFQYKIRIQANGELKKNAQGHTLADAIDVYYLDPAETITNRDEVNSKMQLIGPLSAVLANMETDESTTQGVLYAANDTPDGGKNQETVTIALKMRESAGNEYQDMELGTDFSVQLLATQYTYEKDSFDDQYDANADGTPDHPVFPVNIASGTVSDTEDLVLITDNVTMTIPVGTTNSQSGDTLKLLVTKNNHDENVAISFAQEMEGYEIQLKNQNDSDVAITGLIKIEIVFPKNRTGFKLFHRGEEMTAKNSLSAVTDDQNYYYDSESGLATLLTSSLSPFTATFDKENWITHTSSETVAIDNITINTAEELASFAKNVNEGNNYAGKTVTLGSDIDLTGYMWTPIGSSEHTFAGTFDGNSKTISNMSIYYDGSTEKTIGLFGTIGIWGEGTPVAVVKNVNLKNVYVVSTGHTGHKYYTGGLIGHAKCAKVLDCTVTGQVFGTCRGVGGVIGYVNNCREINNLTFGDTSEGAEKSLVSYVPNTSNDLAQGGIFGYYYYGCGIQNCKIVNATVRGSTLVGGIGGWINNDGNNVTFDGCVVENVDITGGYAVGGITGVYNAYPVIKNCSLRNVSIKSHYSNPDAADTYLGKYGDVSGTIENNTVENVVLGTYGN